MTLSKPNGLTGKIILALVCSLLGGGGGYSAAVTRLVTPTELADAIEKLRAERKEAVQRQEATLRAEILNEIANRTLDRGTLDRWHGEQDANFKAISADLRALQEQQVRTNTILELMLPDKKP